MRRVLAIMIALMFVAIVLSPTMGYSVQIGNHSYSLKATRVSYTIGSQAPSHEPAVQVTRVPFSLKYVGEQTEQTGTMTKGNVTVPVNSANVTAPINAAIIPALPTVAQKFLIKGIIYDDQNSNGMLDSNETRLANWTVNLEQPAGTVISKAVTDNNGGFGFSGLASGEYAVSEVLETGWSFTAPPNGKYVVNLTNNANTMNFGNKLMPTPIQNATTPSNATSTSNVTLAENTSLSK
jgi:hypothetical protein